MTATTEQPEISREIESAEEFFFNTPLYEEVTTKDFGLPGFEHWVLKKIYGFGAKVDGYCPTCKRKVTFTVKRQYSGDSLFKAFNERDTVDKGLISCDRNNRHEFVFYWVVNKGTLQKIGQYPSLADVTQAELAEYRELMNKRDGQEFYKAVGLAAHGVGIGSFVYLRRVFERLIYRRFEEYKATENWNGEDFRRMKMVEKITLMKDHLPPFLVSNKQVYAILSIGLHSLNEKQCLGFFELMKDSIVLILEQDKKKREELARQHSLETAIKDIDLSKIILEDED